MGRRATQRGLRLRRGRVPGHGPRGPRGAALRHELLPGRLLVRDERDADAAPGRGGARARLRPAADSRGAAPRPVARQVLLLWRRLAPRPFSINAVDPGPRVPRRP